jgi:hypothetical protein
LQSAHLEMRTMYHSNDSPNAPVGKLLAAGVLMLLSSCTQDSGMPAANTATDDKAQPTDELPEVVITASRYPERLASQSGSR